MSSKKSISPSCSLFPTLNSTWRTSNTYRPMWRRKSVQALIDGFSMLRSTLPVRYRAKRPTKLQTIRLATEYIRQLSETLSDMNKEDTGKDVDSNGCTDVLESTRENQACWMSTLVPTEPSSLDYEVDFDNTSMSLESVMQDVEDWLKLVPNTTLSPCTSQTSGKPSKKAKNR